jgi:hypothetical protein
MVRLLSLVLSGLVASTTTIVASCSPPFPSPAKESFTQYRLGWYGRWLAEFRPCQFVGIATFDDFYAVCIARGFIVEDAGCDRDEWGRAFTLTCENVGSDLVVRIGSCGPNGVYEDGEGDDLYVERRWLSTP